MARFLLDSGILNDYAGRRNGIYDRATLQRLQGHQVGTATPVLGEMLSGIARSQNPEPNFKALELALKGLTLWAFDRDAAYEYGRIHAALRAKGRPMQSIDIQLAAIALTLGNTVVVTTDGDLFAIDGLAVENWAVES